MNDEKLKKKRKKEWIDYASEHNKPIALLQNNIK